MKPIVLGTHNPHKIDEISHLLLECSFEIKTLKDFPELTPVEENHNTLEENAEKKAKFYAKKTGLLTLADDTGLEVLSLNGEPGVFSARYAGENCSYEENNKKLIEKLSGKKGRDREARFRSIIACHNPETGRTQMVEGSIAGQILETIQGNHGFGYDPIFYIPKLGKTLAELTLEEKNKISHRAIALMKIKEILKNYV